MKIVKFPGSPNGLKDYFEQDNLSDYVMNTKELYLSVEDHLRICKMICDNVFGKEAPESLIHLIHNVFIDFSNHNERMPGEENDSNSEGS